MAEEPMGHLSTGPDTRTSRAIQSVLYLYDVDVEQDATWFLVRTETGIAFDQRLGGSRCHDLLRPFAGGFP